MSEDIQIPAPAELPDWVADAAQSFLSKVDWRKARVETQSWYHDQPIWFAVEAHERHQHYRVLQLTAVRVQGELWWEVAVHREVTVDDQIWLPASEAEGVLTQRFRLTRGAEDAIQAATDMWASIDPTVPDGGGTPEEWFRIPLSSAVRK